MPGGGTGLEAAGDRGRRMAGLAGGRVEAAGRQRERMENLGLEEDTGSPRRWSRGAVSLRNRRGMGPGPDSRVPPGEEAASLEAWISGF